ncbi:uncharacterized protein M6D78_007026 [Vipera latastei]
MEVSPPSRQVVLFFISLCSSGMLCEPFHYSVPEEKKAGSIVANVLKDLKADVKELSARRAQVISKSSRQDFQLDPHSGNIILRDKIDREALCGLTDPCTLFSEILLENPLQVFKIEVQVEDVNDNSPTFSQNQFLFEIPEQTPINARFPLEKAQDLDKGKNAIQNYILSTSEYFKLNVQSKNDGSKYAELLLAKPLDREVIPQFILTLEAVDGGIPRRTGTAQIIIDILDNNDNMPEFAQAVYKVQLMENSHPGSLVAKVEATDKDIGSNARIIYTFSQAPADVIQSFSLNNHSGEITLVAKIDYEENHNYELNIKATDGGGLSTYCKVLVDIEDENDNAPEIVVSSITNPLPENSPPETLVVLFGIRDQDSGDNGRTSCNTDKNLPFILKLTENNYYQLVTQQPLDREQMSQYNITITATDQGSPRLTSKTVISIQLSDVNDNPPMFERSFYDLHLRENNIPGLLIGSVRAVDVDTEQNAKLTYWLLPGKIRDIPVSSYISINSETGNMYAIRSVDYEDIQDFQVMVRAVDKGSPPLSSETTVRVLIRDENDNAPFVLCPLQNSTAPSKELVPRGAETGYLVTKVVAADRDSGQNSWLSYQLLKATDPSLFAVGTQNGEVKTTRPVNIRDSFKHTLIVAVRDNGHPPQSASATLRILLVDGFSDLYMKSMDNPKGEVPQEGDHTLTMYLIICLVAISSIFLLSVMVFIATKFQKRRKFTGSSHSASNFPVGPSSQDKCVDPNTGTPSQAFSYEVCLADGSLSSEFKFLRPFFPVFTMEHRKTLLNPQSRNDCHDLPNQLEERKDISQEEAGIMETCFWKRQGLYVLLSFSFLRVMCASIRFSVPEEKKKGFLVANVLKELKLKAGELSTRRAHLVAEGTQEYFHLDIQTGNLLVKDKIDREALCGQNDPCVLLSQLVLENPLDIFNIEIKIEDVNDNAPRFWKNEVVLDISENSPISMIFPLELAQDDDLGDNSIQNYTLNPNEHFQLEVQKNEDENDNIYLVLKKTLDREKMPHLGLTLMAIDGGVPKKTGTVHININVLDNNDNFPLFSKSEYKTRIKENLPKGTLVITVEATDLDLGSNAQILYSFHQVPERINSFFYLNEVTGEISVWGQIDYEKEKSYNMKIRATDGGGFTGQCKILIEVEDVNDNPPEVSVISLISTLKEDSPPDTMVALFSVRDKDSGDNSKTVCSVEMNLPFVLKGTTNNFYQLVLQSPLDRETVTEYNITITAIDCGSPRLTSTRLINVQISDVNDNPPLFEKPSYDMQIRENHIPGLLIGSVHAVDLDTKQNAKVTYSVLPRKADGLLPPFISINSETGNLYALQSLDYEQIRGFRVTVRASDGGSPSLSSEVIVRIHIIDENDNAPFFLYPLQNNTSPCNELVPKSAEAGYLVTKVVAVDADSGQNSWLSYELLKATDPALFSIGVQNGEVKTRRALNERDTNKQRLVMLVRDNGLPPQTSTAMLNVLLVDVFLDPFLRRVDVGVQEPEEDKTLTKYLVICLAAVSFVFLVCIVVFIVVKILKKDPQSHFTAAAPHFPPAAADAQENSADSPNGSLPRTYRYDVCLTGGSLSSEFRFLRPLFPVLSCPVGEVNVPGNHWTSSGPEDLSKQVAVNGTTKEGKVPLSEDPAAKSGGPSCTVNPTVGVNMNSGQSDWLSYH